MPDCDYCEETFEDEDSYLEHLEASHADELSRIDQRRIDERTAGESVDSNLVTYVGIGLAVVILGGALLWGLSSFGGDGNPAANDPLLTDVQSFDSEGTEHVNPPETVDYGTSPPTSGPHYPRPSSAGYYTERPALENLVHSLEHGAIVIYYDPANLSESAEDDLRSLTQEYTRPWQGVLAVPHVEDDPDSPYVLTAWGHLLRLESYDEETVRAFLDAYRGKGPENPVR
jgi:hypothetical protein